jgi:hypothetical protein
VLGEIAAARYFDFFEIQPCSDRVEFMHQRFGDCGGADAGFAVRAADEEGARCAIGFQIDAGDDAVAKQEWKNNESNGESRARASILRGHGASRAT